MPSREFFFIRGSAVGGGSPPRGPLACPAHGMHLEGALYCGPPQALERIPKITTRPYNHGKPVPITPEEADGPGARGHSICRKDLQAAAVVQGVIGFTKI